MENQTGDTPSDGAIQVLDYWFGDAMERGWPSQSRSALWFGGGKELDEDIARRFGAKVEQAMAGGLTAWEATPLSLLALVIVLDQFTRNLFRGKGRAFDGDARAQSLVQDALTKGWQAKLPLAGAVFLYMPLMHAEHPAQQDECVSRFAELLAGAPPERHKDLQGNLAFAEKHRDIIVRFGRFPYRNAALGRISSDAEQAFLRDGPRFGQ